MAFCNFQVQPVQCIKQLLWFYGLLLLLLGRLVAVRRRVHDSQNISRHDHPTTLECLCSVNSLAVFLSDLVVRPPAILSVHFLPGQPRVSNQNHTGVLAALAHWATFDNVCSRWPEQHRGVLHTSLGVCRVIGKISGIETIRTDIPQPFCWMSKWFLGMEIPSCQPLLASQSHKLQYVVNQKVKLNESHWNYCRKPSQVDMSKTQPGGYLQCVIAERCILWSCRNISHQWQACVGVASRTYEKRHSHNHFRVSFHQRWSLVRHAVHLLRQKLTKA